MNNIIQLTRVLDNNDTTLAYITFWSKMKEIMSN